MSNINIEQNETPYPDAETITNCSSTSLRCGEQIASPPAGEEVVITGIAGKFPESENVYELAENLYNKVDMITDDDRRWSVQHPEIPKRGGRLLNIDKFDAGYFGVHQRQATTMDPMLRMILERAIEAIIDAGYHPSELEGTRTAVFVGTSNSETEGIWFQNNLREQYFAVTGLTRSMIARRVSYFLKLEGLSFNVDTACSSNLTALDIAYSSIRSGRCDAALVLGANICLSPFHTLQFFRLGVLSKKGFCKVFDATSDGYVRSEACGAFFLQKSKDSRRIYAQLVHAKINSDGFTPQGITFPSTDQQMALFTEVLEESKINVNDITYLEAHGTGTVVGDFEELNAIGNVFTKNRPTPLLVGSVKSNVGHSEPASGISSVVKLILAMEYGIIPPNVHFTSPRPGIQAIEENRMRIVAEKTPLPNNNGIFGVNNFGFGGANAQAIFKWNTKTKSNNGLPQDNLPRLICVSGRTEDAVNSLLDALKRSKLDQEYIRLYHQVFSRNFNNHHYRGYTILTKTKELQRCICNNADTRQSLCIVFNDFSSSWTKIYENLKGFPTFEQSLQRIEAVLSTKKLNLQSLLLSSKTEGTNLNFSLIMGNLATQICFADMLKLLGIHPDVTLGLGLSEFVCGYFEDCLTLEETITCVYQVASVICKTDKNYISYFVGLTKDELMQLPKQVDIIQIHPKGVTIAGDQSDILKFVDDLEKEGISVRKVDTSLIKFDTEGFKAIKSELAKTLSQIKPKSIPTRWLSIDDSKIASVEFFLKSINSAFALPQLLQNLNKYSVIFEIGNGQLMGSIDRCQTVNFQNISSTNGAAILLENLGSLYNSGCSMDLAKIYPTVEYPVSRSTPMIAPFIKWNHDTPWFVGKYDKALEATAGDQIFKVDMTSETFSYIFGHVIDGRNLFPATGYLLLVWEALSIKHGGFLSNYRIVFKNCRFMRATSVSKERLVEMNVSIFNLGFFEVREGDNPIVTGQVCIVDNMKDHQIDFPIDPPQELESSTKLTVKDIYKELRLRGYNYTGDFRSLVECSIDACRGKIRWLGNWVTLMDNMLQIRILQNDTRGLYVPVAIKQVSIDAPKHLSCAQMYGENPKFPVYVNKDSGIVKCGGIEIRGLKASRIAKKRSTEEPVLEKYQFVPFDSRLDVHNAVRVNIQLAIENTPVFKVRVIELIDEMTEPNVEPLAPVIFDTLYDLPLIHADVSVFTKQQIDLPNISVENRNLSAETECYLIVGTNLTKRPLVLSQAIKSLLDNGYLLTREPLDFHPSQFQNPHLHILTIYTNNKEKLVLCQKFKTNNRVPLVVQVDDLEEFTWLPQLQSALKTNQDVLIYSQNQPQNGILGLINCIRKETGSNSTRAVLINDTQAPKFNSNEQFYKQQLQKQLGINVYQNGKWGSYRHLKIDPLNEIECEHCIGNTLIKGDLSSLRWIQGPLKFNTKLGPEQRLIHVYYASINFKDVMIASGRIHAEGAARHQEEFSQGLEFVGRDSSGQRFMGITERGGLTNLLAADNSLLWPVPKEWTMEDAATVPVVYATVIFAVFMRSSLKPGSSILIHSGTGGIGQAAISLCLHHGCKVLSTVGTEEKREFLKKRFPKLTDNVIGSSRDTSFEQMVYRETKGRGVDFVLNSLAEEKLLASVRCLARGGHFLEIGKFDFENDNPLHLMLMEKEATFNGVMLDHFFLSSPSFKMQLTQLLNEGIANGSVQPLTRTVFEKDELEKAFRFMTSGKHMGKVIIKIHEEERESVIEPIPTKMKGVPRYRCDSDKTTIILGGLGGFGLELADWLVLRGVRKLVLASRTGVKTGYQASRIKIWESYGVTVLISNADITTKSGCEQLISEAIQLGAVQSIFNLAVILKDSVLENQTEESFKKSFAPKAYATRYLDEITREHCPQLRDFVVFSSVSCGRGNGGQTNYGMSNSVMERICEKRKEEGYPALAIEWGAVGDVGLVAEMQDDDKVLEIGGTLQQRITSCLDVLDTFLNQDDPVVSSIVVAVKKSGGVGANVVESVASLMGIKDLKTVSLHSTLAELGMDSMGGVEIKQTLEREFQIILSPQDIRNLTFSKLYDIQNESSDAKEAEPIINDKPVQGFEMLISQIVDVIITKSELVELQTKSDKQQPDTRRIVFFPGIEGTAKTLLPLSKNLQSRAICVQYSMECPRDTIEQTALNLLPHISSVVTKSEPFYFIAYSFGTAIALEVVRLLEAEGYHGHLICLDGGPELFQKLLTAQLEYDAGEDVFQTSFLCYIMSMYIKQEVITDKQEAIAKCKSFEERLDIMESILPTDGMFSPDQLRKIALSLYKRTIALQKYRSNFELKNTCIKLFKPCTLLVNDLSDDYGLSHYCNQSIDIKLFTGNHLTVLEDLELAKSIDLWAGISTASEN